MPSEKPTHLLLAQLAGNRVLQRFMEELVPRCSLIIALCENSGAAICENCEHSDLAALIEQRKAPEATALIEHHLRQIESRLRLGEPDKKINLAEAPGGMPGNPHQHWEFFL